MRLKLTVTLFLNLFYGWHAIGQTRAIDSVRLVIQKTINERQLLSSILFLCEQRTSLHSDTLLRYANRAIPLAEKTGIPEERAMADYYIAAAMVRMGNTDSAETIINRHFTNLSVNHKKSDAFRKFVSLKGQIMIKSSQYKEALSHFYQYLSEAEKNKDSLGIYFLQTNIGWVNMELGQNREALNWFYKAALIQLPELKKKYAVHFSNNFNA